MKNDELLDLVNEKDEVVGTVWKSEAHKDPSKIHREIDITVFNDLGETLIQQRATGKSNAGKWENTASGHVKAGESPVLAAARELNEELGLKVSPVFYKKVYLIGHSNKEARFFWVYYAIVKGKPKLKLDKKEVSDAKWINPSDLEEFSKNNWWTLNGLSHKIIIELKKYLKL